MQLKWLQLEHFRNYDALKLDFSEAPVLALIGPNAQGKTNLLESIAFLALGKSFRTRRSMETLGWDRPHGRIKGGVERSGKETELEVFFQREPDTRKVKKQSKVVKPSEFLGNLRVVLFTPEHLQLVSGGPKLRRQFLDRTLIQIYPDYVEALGTYQRLLKQRNALLKSIQFGKGQSWELDMWDTRLIHEAEQIWKRRRQFLNFLTKELTPLYQSIAGSKETLRIVSENNEERYEERLLAHREADLRTGSTSVGPHRDDFKLFLEDRELAEFGSRGECRSAVLALKIAEIHFIEAEKNEKPLLLLDDVFSELDESRQKQLGELLKDYQAVITTTSKEHLHGLEHVALYQVKGGGLKPC